jgi:hypothetical protein
MPWWYYYPGMLEYIKESWRIFLVNLGTLTSTQVVMAMVFLFAVFLVFYKASGGFGSHKNK